MTAVFLKVLNMSIKAGWLILAIMIARLILKKAPKRILCLLWSLVAIRLICPFSLESVFSLIPSKETVPIDIIVQENPAIHSGIPVINEIVNPILRESFAPTAEAKPLQTLIPLLTLIWILGILIMLAYAVISYLKLRKSVSARIPVQDGIYACDEVKTPFILGVIHPVIYIPSSLDPETLDYVLRHENAHLKRHDHWWKPLGYLILSVYWFHPLCWIAYLLLSRDIEAACDEKVIQTMERKDLAAYSEALLNCSIPKKRITACPLAFGEDGVKERIKGILNYRKPSFWVIMISLISCAAIALCLFTDPSSRIPDLKEVFTWDEAKANKRLMNVTQEEILNGWGQPDGIFSGFYGDIYANPDDENKLIGVYYDPNTQKIYRVLFFERHSSSENKLFTIRYNLGSALDDFTYTPAEAAAGATVELRTVTLMDADIHVYVDGEEIKKAHYDSDYWGYSFIMPEKDVLVTARFYTKEEIWGSEPDDFSELIAKFPAYFDLVTEKGLKVYVWQMAQNDYSFGLQPGSKQSASVQDLSLMKSATAEEMRAILAYYDLDEKQIEIVPWQNPLSSYIGEYWIQFYKENAKEQEKSKKEYIEKICHMLYLHLTEEQKTALETLDRKERSTFCRFPRERALILGFFDSATKRLTVEEAESIVSGADSYPVIMRKLEEKQPYPDMIKGSGVTNIEYWFDDQGYQKILLIVEQLEMMYIRKDESGNIIEKKMLYPVSENS